MNKIFFLSALLISTNLFATIKTSNIEYKYKDSTMEGYITYDDSIKSLKPGILIVHDWMGLGAFSKEKADLLAKEGYLAFAVDIYGKNIRPKDAKEAASLAGLYKNDRNLLRAHIKAAYDQLLSMREVDKNKILVMGYCFGGTTALELARSGANLLGTISFHGGLSAPTPQDAKNIKGLVLAMHGSDDPFVNKDEVNAFKDEMKNAKVNMEFIEYKGAVHSFTNKAAGNDNSKGAAYNADADKKSWKAFQGFLKKLLATNHI
jgi:dienelactone hydrolase